MNRKVKLAAAVTALGILCLCGTVFAYLTATDSKTNTFTIGNVSGRLTEPHYSETTDHVYPLAIIEKDPTVENTGNEDALAFVEVTIPVENVSVVEEGKKLPKANTELFTFINAASASNSVNTGWKVLGTPQDVTGGKKYVFAYTKVLAKNSTTTTPVFNEVQFVNYANGELASNSEAKIVVKADLIQANNLVEDMSNVTDAELSAAYSYFNTQDN